MIIEDGRGAGYKSRVDSDNRLHVRSVSEQENVHVIEKGDAYNINTGNITFSAAGTLLYIKNNENQALFIEALAIGLGTATVSDTPEITITRGPTGGDLISDATAVSMNVNRDFGSFKTLDADIYKGKSGGTLTGGASAALFYQTANSRLYATVQMILPKGASIAFTLDPKLSSGTVKAYCAAICYLKSPNSAD